MNKAKKYSIAKNAFDLAEILDLNQEDAVAMNFRARLNKKIVELVTTQKITHSVLAKRAKASRTRVTAIMNGQTQGISTDFLLRLLYALGYKTIPSFSKVKLAA